MTQLGKLQFPFKIGKIVDICGARFTIKLTGGGMKIVGSQELAPLKVYDSVPGGLFAVSRVGARIGISFDTESGSEEFTGVVVTDDNSGTVEVQWDPKGSVTWKNELVTWGACRML